MQLSRSEVFNKYPEITFAFRTKIGLGRLAPFYYKLSLSVGDNEEIVKENRKAFFAELELSEGNLATHYKKTVLTIFKTVFDYFYK
jgi:hypothetical protein